jgi:hypothetical protein
MHVCGAAATLVGVYALHVFVHLSAAASSARLPKGAAFCAYFKDA